VERGGTTDPRGLRAPGILDNWSAIESPSEDGILSQAPVVSGFGSGPDALVVWEDSSSTGFRVRGRVLSYTGWSEVMAISSADADAREPT